MVRRGYLLLSLWLVVESRAVAAEPASVSIAIDGGAPVAPASQAPKAAVPAVPAPPAAAPPAGVVLAPTVKQHAPIAVAIVVDQLAAWVLRDRIDKLPENGGFARLRREGKYFPEMAFAHAVTETAPGHASLYTGKLPREHGIVANDVVTADGSTVPLLADHGEPDRVITLDGRNVDGPGRSLDKLEAKSSLVEAAFRSRYPKGQGVIAALSLKERGALFAAGESGDFAIWFDPSLRAGDDRKAGGGFVTTKRYEQGLAGSGLHGFVASYLLADPYDTRDGVARLEDEIWVGLDPAWLREHSGAPGESDYTGFVLSHTASQAAKPGAAFRALPGADRLLLELAIKILKSQPKDLPVLLSLSLSTNDMIGHLFGPDAWEAWDGLRRLDVALAWFFEELDALGPGAWSAVLTADHGIAPLEDSPKHPACGRLRTTLDSARPCSGASAQGARLTTEGLQTEVEVAAAKAGLRDATGARLNKIVAGVAYPYIYLTDAAKAALASDVSARQRLASRLDNELRRRFKSVHAIVDVATYREAAACPDERADRLAALVCHAISPAADRGGDFYVVLKPGAFVDADLVKGTGAGHGSPYGYDRIVPLLVRDPWRADLAGSVESERVPFTQFRDELVRIILSAPTVTKSASPAALP